MTRYAAALSAATALPCPLQVNGLTKRFISSTEPVFTNICFRLEPGQAVALIGANGAGKSTLEP
jgi:ABC-type sugar transport system ATPase subunit